MAISGMKGKKDNSSRKFSGGGPRPDYNDLNRKEAKARAEKRAKLSAQEQLNVLNVRCGVGQGAKRERARLLRAIERKTPTNSVVIDDSRSVDNSRVKAKDRRAAERAAARSK